MSYTLGMTGPINVADFREFIDPAQWRDDLPKGQGGTPVNLLCRELLKRGQKLVVFSCDAAVKDEIVLQGDNLRLCLGPKGVRPARNFFRVERDYLQRAIAREKPDIVHAQWTYEYAMPVQISGIPHVITAHDTPLRYLWHNFIPYRIARTLMAYRVISRARRIVSVSPYVDEHLRRYMFYRGATEVIPNGMPEQVFVQSAVSNSGDSPLTFASILVGWGAYKNGHVAIEAFAKLRKKFPDARFLMFGAGHGAQEAAAQWARERNLDQGIEFVGQLPYSALMARVGSEVDVLVHPSLVEAQPMALIEAMVRGIPVIGGESSGGVPWTLDHGRAGRLVDVRSSDAVAQAMLEFAADPELRRGYAEKGLALARERFHIASVADAWQVVYDQLAVGR
ncbi:MAG: glycosyltransferase family 4 protein [Thiobacillus sp.]|uniref:glycosyltransferase family 4 protein n=1 Tax=Thiobacillus sp. TaxID=924 RepID=UPI002732EA58|nr:glycosyltransferase family 4 protein [Thiobacillus sp.]MDP3584444.1 glycosyltransferase family 4 protein [Thiobacillus sp.]